MENVFIKPVESYTRDLDIIDAYVNDGAKYIHLQTGAPMDECLAYMKKVVDAKSGQLNDPKTLVLTRNKEGDRKPVTATFMRFLNRVKDQNLILSPSLAAYLPEEQKVSTHAQYIKRGVDRRKAVKKEMFKAEERGDHELALVKNGEQNNLKINNNSYSGATVSTATILYYKSTHSSLTSTCRTATSYANSANEKFLAGNRHYYTPEITKANMLALIQSANTAAVEHAMETFGLHYPTADEVVECVMYSAVNYWHSETQLATIKKMCANMTPVERAAVVYIGDLYHLYKHNPQHVMQILTELGTIPESDEVVSDEVWESLDGDTQMLATLLLFDKVNGRSLLDVKQNEPSIFETIKRCGVNTLTTIKKYEPIIRAFWLTDAMPSSIHTFPSIYRKAAIVSDTDSTMFSMQYWVKEKYGKVIFTPEAKRMVFGMVFLVSELIMHLLAIQSANMGVSKAKLRLLAMKNEFYFAVLATTGRSKHYYASQDAKEGLMFKKPRLEVKGVGLRDSKVPKQINDRAKEMMVEIIDTIKRGDKVNISQILKEVGDQERAIIESVQSGRYEFMTSGQVKSKESYKVPEVSNYIHYSLWNEVFAPKYGEIKPPPYSVVKVSLTASNRTEIEAWCNAMDNPEMAHRLREWLLRNRRTDLQTILIPHEVVETTGIPKEITVAIDYRKIITNVMGVYYMMLEPMGVFLQDKNNTRLVSDIY